MKSQKVKICILIVVTTILSLLAIYVLFEQPQENNISTKPAAPEQRNIDIKKDLPIPLKEPTPKKSEDPDLRSTWNIEISEEEQLSVFSLKKGFLYYAEKTSNQVDVYKRSISTGNQIKIFSYKENSVADKSGNLWEGLPPSIDLSGSGKKFVFTGDKGLHTYTISNGKITDLITLVNDHSDNDSELVQPEWSIKNLSAYSLAQPEWSADDRYIKFSQSHYEGSSLGIFDTQSGNYQSITPGSGYTRWSWNPQKNELIKASAGGYDGAGLFIAFTSQSGIFGTSNILEALTADGDYFSEAAFSLNGQEIAFIYYEAGYGKHKKLGITPETGSNFFSITEGSIQSPFFSKDPNIVFYIKKNDYNNYQLLQYNRLTMVTSLVASLPENFNVWSGAGWTEEGFLKIIGKESSSSLVVSGDKNILLILDLEKEEVVYSSSAYFNFVNFIGLVEN